MTLLVDRPSHNCRLLVNRIFFKLKPALGIEIGDWCESVRLKTAKLIFLLLLHMESELVGHAEEVLNMLYFGMRERLHHISYQVRCNKMLHVIGIKRCTS